MLDHWFWNYRKRCRKRKIWRKMRDNETGGFNAFLDVKSENAEKIV